MKEKSNLEIELSLLWFLMVLVTAAVVLFLIGVIVVCGI